VKHASLLGANPLYKQLPSLLQKIIQAVAAILRQAPYYKLRSLSVITVLDEIFSMMVIALRMNDFYETFNTNRDVLIEDIIFRTLGLTPTDIDDFY
jgi:hypothetical protein